MTGLLPRVRLPAARRLPSPGRGWGLLPLVVLASGCGTEPGGSPAPGRASTDPSALFAGGLPAYAQSLDGTAQSRLRMLRAIRRIDPCALVPQDALRQAAPPLAGAAPSDALDSCRLSFSDDGPGERLDVGLVPDADRSSGEEYFQVDGRTVYQGRSWDLATCSFFFDSGLAKHQGAPRDVPDAKVQVRAYRHDNPCGLANEVATAIAKALPASLAARSGAGTVFGEDPCAAVAGKAVAGAGVAAVDFADTAPYRCGLLTEPDERSLWVEFHRLPEREVAKFPAGAEGGVQVWADPASAPLSRLLAGAESALPPVKGAAKQSQAAKPEAPSGPRCAAYAKAPGAQDDSPVYVVVGGQIDCKEAKRLVVGAAQSLTQ